MPELHTLAYAHLAARLYPNWNQADELTDYRPILAHFSRIYQQLALAYSEELDGFCFIAYSTATEVGILEFAFGCCRDCDRLNACQSYEEVGLLVEQMLRSILWVKKWDLPAALMQYQARLLVPEQKLVFEKMLQSLMA